MSHTCLGRLKEKCTRTLITSHYDCSRPLDVTSDDTDDEADEAQHDTDDDDGYDDDVDDDGCLDQPAYVYEHMLFDLVGVC